LPITSELEKSKQVLLELKAATPLADFAGMFAPNHLDHLVQLL